MKPLSLLLLFAFMSSQMSVAQTSNTNSLQSGSSSCPLMEVNIIAVQDQKDVYKISYCNHGNSIARASYLEVDIPHGLTLGLSSLPFTQQQGNSYRFELGDVAHTTCSEFYIHIPNSELSLYCTDVQIYPNNPCQAMIDRYITNHAGGNTDPDGNDGGTTTTLSTINAFSNRSMAMPIAPGGNANSILEDNVMLNNIPVWDSLLNVMGGNTNSIRPDDNTNTNSNTTNTTVGQSDKQNNGNSTPNPSTFDISTLASAKHCLREVNTAGISQGGNNTTIDFNNATSAHTGMYNTAANNNDDNNFKKDNSETTETLFGENDNSSVTVNVYPNPFRDYTTIEINGASYQQIQVEILDVAGRIVKVQQADEQQQIKVSRDQLGQGVYIYRLSGDGALVQTGKIIVQ